MIDKLKENKDNPRKIDPKKLEQLKQSIRDFPEMLEKRSIVYDENFIVLGGNQRFRALKELSAEGFEIKDSYFEDASGWTEEQKKEFVIKDNVSSGDWDIEALRDHWSLDDVDGWGLDKVDWVDKEVYTKKVKSPVYEPSGEDVGVDDLVDQTKAEELISGIRGASLPVEIKEFLEMAATRHYVFNYQKIADYYASADKEVQDLMERSALVVIDYDKAIEYGFVQMTEFLLEMQDDEDSFILE